MTGPAGKVYVGLSKNPKARWYTHLRKARTTDGRHPFYDAIRKHGGSAFSLEVLETCETLEAAKACEVERIAGLRATERTHGYNVSAGGEYDAGTGGVKFWADLKADPERLRVYLGKLGAAQRLRSSLGLIPYPQHLIDLNQARTARERWKIQSRASRVAARSSAGRTSAGGKAVPSEVLRAAWRGKAPSEKKRHQIECRKRATLLWAARTDLERAEVSDKIAETLRGVYASGTAERERLQMSAARGRALMDRAVQGAAASKGLKKFWADLKADPERYADHVKRRTASLKKTLGFK